MIKCNCSGWLKSSDQIISVQQLAAIHGANYTGDTFQFCPWCGKRLDDTIQIRHDDDGLWLSVKTFSGKQVMLNLSGLSDPFINEIFMEWAQPYYLDQRTPNKANEGDSEGRRANSVVTP